MKNFILGIAVIVAAFVSVPVFAAQANFDLNVNTEVAANEDYVPVAFKDLPEETQELLLTVFEGYDIAEIFQSAETKLLKLVVVKDDEKKVFVQNENGEFIEQE